MQLMGTFKKVRKVVISAFICSVMSPVGISIGMAILETGGEESHIVQIINGVLQVGNQSFNNNNTKVS